MPRRTLPALGAALLATPSFAQQPSAVADAKAVADQASIALPATP